MLRASSVPPRRAVAPAPLPPPCRLSSAARCWRSPAPLCVGVFFRNQIANGFTLLLGDRHDAVIALSIMEHWRNVLAGAAEWSRTAYFHPVPGTLGYNDGYLLFGLVYAAFRAAGADPFLGGELTNMAMRAVGFLAMHAACRRVLGLSFGWSLLGAALFTLSNNLFIRASHAQLFSIGFLPALAVLLHGAGSALLARTARGAARMGRGLRAALRGAADDRLLHGLVLRLPVRRDLSRMAADRRRCAAPGAPSRLSAERLGPLALLAALALVANAPFLMLYLPKAAETGMHSWETALQHAPTPLDVLHVGEANLLFGWLVTLLNGVFRPDFPAWSERMTGLTPVLLLVFAASVVWLWRGAGGMEPVRRAWLRALALASLATWALMLALRRRHRVVARLERRAGGQGGAGGGALPARAGDPGDRPGGAGPGGLGAAASGRGVMAPLAAVLLLEQANGYAPLFLDRPLELARLRAVPAPPAECRAFYVSAAREESRFGEAVEDPYNHNTEAMLIAAVLRLPTVNGISTFNPPGWPASWPGSPATRRRSRPGRATTV